MKWWYCAVSNVLGLWSGLIIGYITECYASRGYNPVQEIAETQKQSAATGSIYGLALGHLSCIEPVICLGVTILVAHTLCRLLASRLEPWDVGHDDHGHDHRHLRADLGPPSRDRSNVRPPSARA